MPWRRAITFASSVAAPSAPNPEKEMVPSRLGTRPMRVRSSTDFPLPDAPTTPRISPRRSSIERWSSTTCSPNPTTRSRASITADRTAASMPSHSNGCEKYREHAIEHDDKKDRLHYRGGGLQAERFGAAFHLEPLAAGHDANRECHERRLDHADLEMRH